MTPHSTLTRYAWLSIGAALVTMAIKAAAYFVTGSVAFLSDATCFEAGRRLVQPQPIEQPGLGIVIALIAAGINLSVAVVLRRVGRRERSITFAADAQALLLEDA